MRGVNMAMTLVTYSKFVVNKNDNLLDTRSEICSDIIISNVNILIPEVSVSNLHLPLLAYGSILETWSVALASEILQLVTGPNVANSVYFVDLPELSKSIIYMAKPESEILRNIKQNILLNSTHTLLLNLILSGESWNKFLIEHHIDSISAILFQSVGPSFDDDELVAFSLRS